MLQLDSILRHAVRASKVASLRQRYSEICVNATKAIREHRRLKNLEQQRAY